LSSHESYLAQTERRIGPLVERTRRKQAAIAERERREAAAAEALAAVCGPKPSISSWDGEVIGLERALKKTAHDPDSIDVENCTDPILTKKRCWITTCDVRGKNMFGAKIYQRKQYSVSRLGFEEVN
jgi:hypothetical protein